MHLLCHAPTAATRAASFPADEFISPEGRRWLGAARVRLGRFDRRLTSPARRAIETAEALGLDATVEPALADCDFGAWAGRTIGEVQTSDPGGLDEWIGDPAKAPHGGESSVALMERVAAWLAGQLALRGATLAVTHASVIRAAILVAIDAGPRSFRRIDVAPLSLVRLSGVDGRWNLVSLGKIGAGGGGNPAS